MEQNGFTKNASRILDKMGYKYDVEDDDTIVMAYGSELGGDIPLMQFIKRVSETVAVYTTVPYNIKEDRRDEIARKIMNINYGLVCGSFDMDVRDGDIRFRSAFFCRDPEKMKKEQLIGNMGLGVAMFDNFSVAVKDAFEDRDIAGLPSTIDLSGDTDLE